MERRLAEAGDLWREMLAGDRRPSLEGATAKLRELLTDDDWKEALAASTRRPTSRKNKPNKPNKPNKRRT
jgi:hypothetical protein